jgi:MoaA/NifB/PqqE/SkfB family radical SAM enzyme
VSDVMNLTRKLYQLPVLERISATSWKVGNSAPYVVELDPTASCDLACPGCISEDVIATGGRFSDKRLIELGKEFIAVGVKAVILIGGGEPLSHPRAGDLIRLLGENDVHVGITTNGSFIDRHLEAIAQYSRWTRVSMDAATDDTFSQLRPTKGAATRKSSLHVIGSSKFGKILDNMRLLSKSKTGKLGYSFLIQTAADGPGVTSNIGEIYEAALLARDIGCDYFEVKPTYAFREGIAHALQQHDPWEMEEATRQVARLDELETNTFKVIRAINLQFSLGRMAATAQPKDYHQCPSTHLRTTVTPGGVYVCPYWRGKDHMKVGNASSTSFSEMWGGDLRREVMERLDPSVDCQFHCLRHETNLTAIAIKNRMEGGGEVIGVEEFDRFV